MLTFQHAINQLRHRQQLLAILIFSLVAIMVWIGVSLISSQSKTAISPELRRLADPLTPNLNQTALQTIERRKYISNEDLGDFPIFIVVDPKSVKPSPSPSPITPESENPIESPPLTESSIPTESPLPTESPSPSPSETPVAP